MDNDKFLVMIEGKIAPKVEHITYQSAYDELLRLLKLQDENKVGYVIKVVATARKIEVKSTYIETVKEDENKIEVNRYPL